MAQFAVTVRASFQNIRASFAAASESAGKPVHGEIDWDFWGKVTNDYETVARKHPRALTRQLQQGIPTAIRGMVWQLIARSKDLALEAIYASLLDHPSVHEKAIQRDVARTFPTHPHFMEPGQTGQESLFNVCKAYSLYDEKVGYCQGLAFIVGPMLLNMPDEEAFSLLVKLMSDYGFRDMFAPDMAGLQLRLFQFDRLLEEQFPALHRHLLAQDIKSSMYVSQWFMTLFAYRFPLDMVLRIVDIVIAEGFEIIFKFAFALLQRNAAQLVTLPFEQLLDFLKIGLFDAYASNIDALITDAFAIKLSRSRLDRLAAQFEEDQARRRPQELEMRRVKAESDDLLVKLRKTEASYEQLNQEHVALANRFLNARVAHDATADRIESLEEQVTALKALLADDRRAAEKAVQADMDRLATKNVQLTQANAELQEQVANLEEWLRLSKHRYMECENARCDLEMRLNEMIRVHQRLGRRHSGSSDEGESKHAMPTSPTMSTIV
ncbi:hypothetical protein CXG81DRAFT_10959 [Caulochytrium protostelioides]|uniref:Rab-GAP TBC domain-containing protein n=1 Tax=Caulochytrium protostelioides TaxID=1555241 RepID=A0A4P9XAY3_9FUNG|nr:hypothetical protein CXG81DRAFT_10959 [Caulochytrium protostelioides]|eukprot:RKP02290.1 hypothetical protein CXG81DRAFT_10959 [Caulochytrium protostelioides]